MGMYDIIIIDLEQLPINPDDRWLLEEAEFQTKDLGNQLAVYEIRKKGKISLKSHWNTTGTPPSCRNLCGEIEFYSDDLNGDFWTFRAEFIDGKMVSISHVKEDAE